MDTLLFEKLKEIQSLQDTLILNSFSISSSIDKLKEENLFLKVLPFLGVVIGGLLTYFGQLILKNKEIKLARMRDLRETISKVFINLNALNFYLRELAYLEVDSKYQFHLSCTEEGDAKKRALEEHYNDYKFIAENRSKIAQAIAEMHTAFISYYKCKNEVMPEENVIKIREFTDHILNLKRHPEYLESIEITTEMLEKDIHSLKSEYTKNILGIVEIAELL